MKKIMVSVFSVLVLSLLIFPTQYPDFAVTKFVKSPSGFLHIHLENRSQTGVTIEEAWRDKPFLTIYINKIKRAEFPVKLIDPALFKKNGIIVHKTNFRTDRLLTLTVKINITRFIQESSYINNELTEELDGKK